MEELDNNWYKTWFDTEFYHDLYSHRDEGEARIFISTMIMFLEIHPGQRVMDMACGKGRHSRVLESHGLEVVGFDLSKQSIDKAKIYESETMAFDVHDMRKSFTKFGKFDVIFNLFTSFGYFSDPEDDQKTIRNVHKALVTEGFFVQDYLNAASVIDSLPQNGSKETETSNFSWKKHIADGLILKDITVENGKDQHYFQEKVKVYSLEELVKLHEEAGLKVQDVFGSYELDPYSEKESPRIIIISKKA